MNALEQAIQAAYQTNGQTKAANKAYLEFIKANFIIPIEKHSTTKEPIVLYLEDNQHYFLPVFTNINALNHWAKDIGEHIQLLKLSGVDLLKGVGEQVTICLNPGSPLYKEFNPGELARLRSMVFKFFKEDRFRDDAANT